MKARGRKGAGKSPGIRHYSDRAHGIAAQTQPRVAKTAVRARGLGLQPVEQAQAELSCSLGIAFPLKRIDTANRSEPVVVLRPVDHRDVAGGEALREICSIEDSAEAPPGVTVLGLEEAARQWLVGLGAHWGPAQQRPGPSGRPVIAPEFILPGLVDRVVLARAMLDRKADRDRLLVARIVAEPTYPAIAGVERAAAAGFGGQRQVGAIIIANALPHGLNFMGADRLPPPAGAGS